MALFLLFNTRHHIIDASMTSSRERSNMAGAVLFIAFARCTNHERGSKVTEKLMKSEEVERTHALRLSALPTSRFTSSA
jgi:hypothetical protein